MITLSPPPCWGYAQAQYVVKLTLYLMPTVKSCFKLNKYKQLFALCWKYLAKTFDTLIKIIYMLLYATERSHPKFVVIYFKTWC